MEMKNQLVEDDECDPNEWTEEELTIMKRIEDED